MRSGAVSLPLTSCSCHQAALSPDCTHTWLLLCCGRIKESEDISHRLQVEKRNLFLQKRVVGQGKVPSVLQGGHPSQHQHRPHPTLISKHDVRCQPSRRENNICYKQEVRTQ